MKAGTRQGDWAAGEVRSAQSAVSRLRPGGIMVADLWRPKNDAELSKAREITGIMDAMAHVGKTLREKLQKQIDAIGTPERVLIGTSSGHNIWVDVGLTEVLERALNGSSFTAADFVGLKDTGTPVAGDTMASHAGWATITPYSTDPDPAYNPATAAAKSIDNSASKASFAINATDVVYGAFLKDNNTRGGATGILLCVADFAASRSVENGDTLDVTYTCTSADDGA